MKRDATLEKIWRMLNGNRKPRKSTSCSTKRMAATLLALTWPWHFKALTLTTLQRIMQLKTQKHYMHVDGRQKKVFTVSRGRLCLMYVMHLSTMTMLLLLAQMSNRDGGTGMKTMLRDINVIPNGTGQGIPYASSWSSTYESFGPLRTFHSFSPPVSPSNDTCRVSLVLVFGLFGLGFLVCFVVFLFLVLQVSWNFSNPPRVLDLDDRQGLIASSAMQQKKKVQSKSVTSCAGMTAHFVLLAQTKVGFLSGGRSRRMKELPEKEVLAQLEEAYARATVALTRAQKLCIIMGLLDMRGLLGAATVIGCLKYGAGVCGVHVSNPAAEVFLKDGSLNDGPDDEAFLLSLRRSLKTARGAYPPVALAEIYQEYKSPLTKIRRLHLMVVDLGRSRSVSPQVYQDFMNCRLPHELASSLNTLPVPISRKDCPFKTRFVFAYGVDNSDRPSYLLWPIRGGNGQFLLVDPWSGNYFDLEAAKFMEPIGIEHFFDAFSLDRKRPLKVDAATALRIPLNEVSDLLVVKTGQSQSI